MTRHQTSFVVLALVSSLAFGGPAQAGAPSPEDREFDLAHVCKGGPNADAACTDASECPGSTCVINFASKSITAKLTILVDDDVSNFNDDETGLEDVPNVVAATVLLEVKKDGKRVLAQTYQNLDQGNPGDLATLIANLQAGPFLGDTETRDNRTTETNLNAAAGDASILQDFLFQAGDSELADALRALFGLTGTPIIAETPEKIEKVLQDNHLGDSLASVLRFKVKIRFVPPPAS
jgi:hypothetical protein